MVKRMNLTKGVAVGALSGLLLAGPSVWAEEAHHPAAGAAAGAAQSGTESGTMPSGSGVMAMGGSATMGQGMVERLLER